MENMEFDTEWEWFLNTIGGQVRWQGAADKNSFSANLHIVLRRDEVLLDFGNTIGTKMNYKGPGAASLFEKVSLSQKGGK